MVEKFFDVIQNSYKKHLKGKGVIEPDYQERGAHDYRKDACLTLREFEQIIIHCILYYNNSRIVDFPFTDEMLADGVKPNSSSIFAWGIKQMGANLIAVTPQMLIQTLLPRATGTFSRKGLRIHGLRYKHDDYTDSSCLCFGADRADDGGRYAVTEVDADDDGIDTLERQQSGR